MPVKSEEECEQINATFVLTIKLYFSPNIMLPYDMKV